MIYMKRIVLRICIVAMLLAPSLAYSQMTLDVTKITCDQFLMFKVADPNKIAIWLSGYYHGKMGNPILSVLDLKENVQKLKELCLQNTKLPVMQVIEQKLLQNSDK